MAYPKPPNTAETRLTGSIKTLTYVDGESGYFVAKVEVAGQGERTVTGNAPLIHEGETLTAEGKWTTSKWGPQFKAVKVLLSSPTHGDAVVKYLANSVKGVGKGFAQKLWDECGDQLFEMLERRDPKLYTIKRMGKTRIDNLLESFELHKATAEVMIFLHKAGLSNGKATKILAKYGDDAIRTIRTNPYVLCKDIWGIGFKIADEAALKQGIKPQSDFRVQAGVQYTLSEAEGNGSCGLPVDELLEHTSVLLGVEYDLIEAGIAREVMAGEIQRGFSGERECLFRTRPFRAEAQIAENLLERIKRTPSRKVIGVDEAILHAELNMGKTLETAQREAVRVALLSQVCVLTGGPGTGKTTITRVILDCLTEAGVNPVLVTAPTGKAAKRAEESTGYPGGTIHRVLEVQSGGKFKFNDENLLNAGAFFIDESSMVDIYLLLAVLRALPANCRLYLIGDVDQLESVGVGKVLRDIIESKVLPCVRLNTPFRQAANSQIVVNAYEVNAGRMPNLNRKSGSDFQWTELSPRDPNSEVDKDLNRQAILAEVLRLATNVYKLGFDPIRDVQVLAPMKKGLLGTESLNRLLQDALNPYPQAEITWAGRRWRTGDKVMQQRNNYEKVVLNGDVGLILEIEEAEKTLTVDFAGSVVSYQFSELEEIILAYAFTVHKSQGSEFPVVIMPLDTSHWMMLKRNLVYTGFTRAKQLMLGVGSRQALRIAVESADASKRWTRLKDLLQQGLPAQLKLAA